MMHKFTINDHMMAIIARTRDINLNVMYIHSGTRFIQIEETQFADSNSVDFMKLIIANPNIYKVI